jgi:hypothetical protein
VRRVGRLVGERDDPVDRAAVEQAAVDVGEEVGDGDRRDRRIDFDDEGAGVGLDAGPDGGLARRARPRRRQRQRGNDEHLPASHRASAVDQRAGDDGDVERDPADARQVDVPVVLLQAVPEPEQRREQVGAPRHHRDARGLAVHPDRQDLRQDMTSVKIDMPPSRRRRNGVGGEAPPAWGIGTGAMGFSFVRLRGAGAGA